MNTSENETNSRHLVAIRGNSRHLLAIRGNGFNLIQSLIRRFEFNFKIEMRLSILKMRNQIQIKNAPDARFVQLHAPDAKIVQILRQMPDLYNMRRMPDSYTLCHLPESYLN